MSCEVKGSKYRFLEISKISITLHCSRIRVMGVMDECNREQMGTAAAYYLAIST
jgi:hypothetical protein